MSLSLGTTQRDGCNMETPLSVGDEMKDIRVKKDALIAILKKNRAAHGAASKQAFEDYKIVVSKQVTELLERTRAGERVGWHVIATLDVPMDHTSDYDRVLAMLDMDENEEILLSETDFRVYVQDDWGWKDNWSHSNKRYSDTARAVMGG